MIANVKEIKKKKTRKKLIMEALTLQNFQYTEV